MKHTFKTILLFTTIFQGIFAEQPTNKIFDVDSNKPGCILLNVKNAYTRFHKFDLNNQRSMSNFTQFKNACRDGLTEYKENNAGEFAKKIVVLPHPGYDIPTTRSVISNQVTAALNREDELRKEIIKIHHQYNSSASIATKTGMTFAFICGGALINPYLPSFMQLKPESFKWIIPTACAAAGLNGKRLWNAKKEQDQALSRLNPEHQEVFHAAYSGIQLLNLIDSVNKK